MATPTCTTASLLETIPCFSAQVLNPQQMIALRIWFLANELSVNGGNNYTNLLSSAGIGGLVSAANNLFERATEPQLEQALTTIYRNNAVSAGATISSDIQTLLGSVAALTNPGIGMVMLQKMELTLLCALGNHRAPPA